MYCYPDISLEIKNCSNGCIDFVVIKQTHHTVPDLFPICEQRNSDLSYNWRSEKTFDGNCSPLSVSWGLEGERGPETGGQQLRHLVHDPVQPHLSALVCERVHIENVAGAVRQLYLVTRGLMCHVRWQRTTVVKTTINIGKLNHSS